MWNVECYSYFWSIQSSLVSIRERKAFLSRLKVSTFEFSIDPLRVEHLCYIRKSFEKSVIPDSGKISVEESSCKPYVLGHVYSVYVRVYLYPSYWEIAFELYFYRIVVFTHYRKIAFYKLSFFVDVYCCYVSYRHLVAYFEFRNCYSRAFYRESPSFVSVVREEVRYSIKLLHDFVFSPATVPSTVFPYSR